MLLILTFSPSRQLFWGLGTSLVSSQIGSDLLNRILCFTAHRHKYSSQDQLVKVPVHADLEQCMSLYLSHGYMDKLLIP